MMEEESTNSSEEVEQENNDLGIGRSYECVFCKRGFNTAQALGGHMNIHRKDRARNKPNSNPTKQQRSSFNDLGVRRFSPQDQQPHHFAYATYFPAAASSVNDSDRQPSDPAMDGDWRMRLSLEFSPSSIVEKNRRQDKELDLELRLGYHDS